MHMHMHTTFVSKIFVIESSITNSHKVIVPQKYYLEATILISPVSLPNVQLTGDKLGGI